MKSIKVKQVKALQLCSINKLKTKEFKMFTFICFKVLHCVKKYITDSSWNEY